MSGFILNAPEPVYGQGATTGYRDTGINADTLKSRQDVLQRAVGRRRTGAPVASGRRIIDKGGEGDLQIDVGTNGLGMYLKAAASTSSSTLIADATSAHRQLFTWTDEGPPIGTAGGSIVSEDYRQRDDGVYDVTSYRGGKVAKWTLGQNLDGFLVLTLNMDYLSSVILDDDPERAGVITPAVAFQYAWPDALITLTPKDEDDGDPETECLSSFTLEGDNAIDTEMWCIKRGTTKHEPSRSAIPAPTGTLEWKYQSDRYFRAFKNGTQFSVTAQWQAPVAIEEIDDVPVYPSLEITVGTIAFQEPNDPEWSVTEATKQAMPFVVLDDESGDPVISWDQVTSDTAL